MLAAAASLGTGLTQALPAYAAPPAPVVHKAVPAVGDTILGEINVDPKTNNGCGEFKGTLEYTETIIKGGYSFNFDVFGTLFDHCQTSGVSRLFAHWTCDGGTQQGPQIGETTTQENINYNGPDCPATITNMFVEICWHNDADTVHQCADSAKLNA